MPTFGPIKRKELVGYLKKLGFEGLYIGDKHQYMIKGEIKLVMPNPHQCDIGKDLLVKILRQAGINRDEWENLR